MMKPLKTLAVALIDASKRPLLRLISAITGLVIFVFSTIIIALFFSLIFMGETSERLGWHYVPLPFIAVILFSVWNLSIFLMLHGVGKINKANYLRFIIFLPIICSFDVLYEYLYEFSSLRFFLGEFLSILFVIVMFVCSVIGGRLISFFSKDKNSTKPPDKSDDCGL